MPCSDGSELRSFTSGSQMRAIPHPQTHLTTSADIFDCYDLGGWEWNGWWGRRGVGCYWHPMSRGQRHCYTSYNAQDSDLLPHQELSIQNVNDAEVEKPCSRPLHSNILHSQTSCYRLGSFSFCGILISPFSKKNLQQYQRVLNLCKS